MTFLKRILDLTGAILVLLTFLPLMIVIAIAIKVETKGPVFFVQKRIGLNGAEFDMFKFRSMVNKAEKMGTGLFSYADDARITWVGRFIRKTSLDELPQVFNVLNGSMSLVGPRPPVTYELGDYMDFTPHMKIRFSVKPGITGLAQISGRNKLDWDQKIVYDNQYVDWYHRWGIIIDIKVLFQTVWVVLSAQNTIEEQK